MKLSTQQMEFWRKHHQQSEINFEILQHEAPWRNYSQLYTTNAKAIYKRLESRVLKNSKSQKSIFLVKRVQSIESQGRKLVRCLSKILAVGLKAWGKNTRMVRMVTIITGAKVLNLLLYWNVVRIWRFEYFKQFWRKIAKY